MSIKLIDGKKLKRILVDRRYNFIFIDLANLAHNLNLDDPARFNEAKKSASSSTSGVLPGLKSTESNFEWTLIYNHARQAQIRPFQLNRMRRKDLEYLAGMSLPHPTLSAPKAKNEKKTIVEARHAEQTKLQGNAIRAQEVLRFRNILWAGLLAAIATTVGILLTKALDAD